jgi:LPS O-antigen subunit length determinant protein (WzzB/FepE family)
MNNRKMILVVVSIAVLVGLAGAYMNKPAPIAKEVTKEPVVLTNVQEVDLQKQLQNILASKNEARCAELSDGRYQFACHDLFKNTVAKK